MTTPQNRSTATLPARHICQLTHGHLLLDLSFVDAVAGRQPGGGQQIDLAVGEPFKIGLMGGVAAGDPVAPLLQNGSHQGPGHAVE